MFLVSLKDIIHLIGVSKLCTAEQTLLLLLPPSCTVILTILRLSNSIIVLAYRLGCLDARDWAQDILSLTQARYLLDQIEALRAALVSHLRSRGELGAGLHLFTGDISQRQRRFWVPLEAKFICCVQIFNFPLRKFQLFSHSLWISNFVSSFCWWYCRLQI